MHKNEFSLIRMFSIVLTICMVAVSVPSYSIEGLFLAPPGIGDDPSSLLQIKGSMFDEGKTVPVSTISILPHGDGNEWRRATIYLPVKRVKTSLIKLFILEKETTQITEVLLNTKNKGLRKKLNALFGKNLKFGKCYFLFADGVPTALVYISRYGRIAAIDKLGRQAYILEFDKKSKSILAAWKMPKPVNAQFSIEGSKWIKEIKEHTEHGKLSGIELIVNDTRQAGLIIDNFIETALGDDAIFQYETQYDMSKDETQAYIGTVNPGLRDFIDKSDENLSKVLQTTQRLYDNINTALDAVYRKLEKYKIKLKFNRIVFHFSTDDNDYLRVGKRMQPDGTFHYAVAINVSRFVNAPRAQEEFPMEAALFHEAGHRILSNNIESIYRDKGAFASAMYHGLYHPNIAGLKFDFERYGIFDADQVEAVIEVVANWFALTLSGKRSFRMCLALQLANCLQTIKSNPGSDVNLYNLANFVAIAHLAGENFIENLEAVKSLLGENELRFARHLVKFAEGLRLKSDQNSKTLARRIPIFLSLGKRIDTSN